MLLFPFCLATFPHIAYRFLVGYLMDMKYQNRLTPERYLENKEYFDQGLIDSLANQTEQNKKLKDRILIYQARVERDKAIITNLKLKYKNMTAEVWNLKNNKSDNQNEIDHLENEIKNVYDILNKEVDSRDKTINELLEIIKKQDEEISDLKRKERKRKLADTTNTNNPSSTYRFDDGVKNKDRKKKIANSRKQTGRSRGGQPGHEPTRAKLSEHCDNAYEIHVKAAPSGAQPVYDEAGNVKYYCAQVKDARYVTEIQEYHFIVDDNGITLNVDTMNRFRISPLAYSNHLKSQVLYLQSKGVISLNRLCMILNELSEGKLNITEGTVVNWMKEFNKQSEEYRSYAMEQILADWVVHVDETGWKKNGKQAWVHAICTKKYAYFVMTDKRKDTERGPLWLLRNFKNVLTHDHFKPYYELLDCIHAECNAHIDRYLQAGIDFDQLEGCQQMYNLLIRSLLRRDELMADGIDEMEESEYEAIKAEYLQIIDKTLSDYEEQHKGIPAKYIPDGIKTLRRMKKYANAHLLFLKDFDVEYTNNAAERQCRVIKAHKKISGQCYSIDTGEYLTSLLTVTQSANLQKINTLRLMSDIMCGQWARPSENRTDAREV